MTLILTFLAWVAIILGVPAILIPAYAIYDSYSEGSTKGIRWDRCAMVAAAGIALIAIGVWVLA